MEQVQKRLVSPITFFGFCALELLILITLKIVQEIDPDCLTKTFLMFAATLFNALFMAFVVLRVKKAGGNVAIMGLPLAAFITLLGDCFLVLANNFSKLGHIDFLSPLTSNMIGFFLFGILQVIYAVYLGLNKYRLAIRVGFYFVFTGIMFALDLLPLVRFIACLSMTQLILNLIYSWIEHKKKHSRASLLLAIGLTLFLVGDILIMARMVIPHHGFLYEAVRFMVWVFYVPAQVVLTSAYLVDRTEALKQ